MEFIKLIFEHTGTLVINNEVTVTEFPYSMNWFDGADLVVDTLQERFVFNTQSTLPNDTCRIFEINPNHYVIRIEKKAAERILQVTHASTHFIFPKRYIVEIGQGNDTSFFTIYTNKENRFAVDLGVKINNPNVVLENNKIVIKDELLSFAFDPSSNTVTWHRRYFKSGTPIPFVFLQYLQNGEYSKARSMLAFNIDEQGLEKYFGKFEILLNNYLQDENIFSIIQGKKVKNLRFEIEGAMIQNVE
ncbi:MAG: hypothetical protein FWE45_00655 [Firmicutes bacterium]|nr:hypothetical protein [Bacillota bacterium]